MGYCLDDPIIGSFSPAAEGNWFYVQADGIIGANISLIAGDLRGESGYFHLSPGIYFGQFVYTGTFLGYSRNGVRYTPYNMTRGPILFDEGELFRSNAVRFELVESRKKG
jgi:hypothetical protein